MRPLSEGEKASSSLQWLTIALPLAVLAIVIGALVYVAGAGLS
ncbi:hypothetical protein SJ05684_b50860 (plasmid) [Sinorhizobium sojae CCBAU 05684]|uniref:Uncharacterized protein n=2 Tax=Sinorhizobium sojae TaxID=716925 RepID=A0A249PJH4_9HYPH|nr:hypothetical protein SJ05684_b50860 [Sinorhizobium sojae CCBAU 05684]